MKDLNWFQRHPNWTALGLAVGSVLFFELFTRVSLGFNNVFLGSFLEPGLWVVIVLIIVIFTFFILSAIGFGWVLYRKNRSSRFLSFYLIIAALCLAAFIYQAVSVHFQPGRLLYPLLV